MKSTVCFSLAMLLAVAAPLGATSPELFILEQEGQRLLQAKQYEEGAAKLEEASRRAAAEGDWHAAYWALLKLAEERRGPWPEAKRLEWFGRAVEFIERCDHTGSRWRMVDLPNAVQTHMMMETIHAYGGSLALGFAEHERAEACMRAYWPKVPTEAELAAAPDTVVGLYAELLTERAEYEGRSGRMLAAEDSLRKAADVLRRHLVGNGIQRPLLCRTLNNLGVLLGEMGRSRAYDAVNEEALALREGSAAGLYPELNRLRSKAEVNGPSDEIIASMLEKAAALRAKGRKPDALQAERRAASVMVRMTNRTEEGFALFDRVAAIATNALYRQVAADTFLWRAKARGQHGHLGTEADFLQALEFFRTEGNKPREYAVYFAYAEWLLEGKRIPEALAVAGEAVRLNTFMQCRWRRPAALALYASALLASGRGAEADAVWTEILALLDTVDDLDEVRRLGTMVDRLTYLAARERRTELASWMEMTRAFAARSGLTDYQKRGLEQFDPAKVAAAPAAVVPPSPVELQPLYLATRTVASAAPACGFFWLVNPAAMTQRVPLTARSSGTPAFGFTSHTTLALRCGATVPGGATASQTVDVPPHSLFPVAVAMDSAPEARTLHLSVSPGATAQWKVVTGGDRLPARADFHASLVACNPFHGIPLYHELAGGSVDAKAPLNFRVRASSPCRVEVYEVSSGTLLAVDATGDGAFHRTGDLVLRDADRDGDPDVALRPVPVTMRVYPLPGQTAPVTLDLAVELRDADGTWLAIGHDRLLGFGAVAVR